MRIFWFFLKWIKSINCTNPDRFFKDSIGVIHVGANIGQERNFYQKHALDVIWIEPIPEVFEVLSHNISSFNRQKAYKYLVTDKNDMTYNFNIANNFGASSSILNIKHHKDIWPNIFYERSIELKSITLKKFIHDENINIEKYNTLVMDTQGSELLVLKGAEDLLLKFKYIKTEVPDFEAYAGCCQIKDIENFLRSFGFKELTRFKFASRPEKGSYYNIVYKKLH